MLTSMIKERVGFIGNVIVMPGENEMEALTYGTLRVLRGEEKYREI
jgi:butyrate kinase